MTHPTSPTLPMEQNPIAPTSSSTKTSSRKRHHNNNITTSSSNTPFINNGTLSPSSSSDSLMSESQQIEMIESLSKTSKFYAKIFRACFGALSLFLALLALGLGLLRENFGIMRASYGIFLLLHALHFMSYCLSAFRAMRSKRNIKQVEDSFENDFTVEDAHRVAFWSNVALSVLIILLWIRVLVSNMDEFSALPWYRRLLLCVYAGIGPCMMFFTELSLHLMSNTNLEVMSLWNYTYKYKSI